MNSYPENDEEFEDKVIKSVGAGSVTFDDGWSLFIPSELAFVPLPGMTARLYGRGIGYSVRGIFINGARVYYRTKAEEKEYREIEVYGKDAADWLARWTRGKPYSQSPWVVSGQVMNRRCRFAR